MDRADFCVRLGRQKSIKIICRLTVLHLADRFHCGLQMPAKNANGRLSSKANQTGGFLPSGKVSFSEKLANGTTHRLSTPSQRRQCEDAVLRTLDMPGS